MPATVDVTVSAVFELMSDSAGTISYICRMQQLVDQIADRIGRPVLVEDRRQRVISYSAHVEPFDDVRRDSILRRSTTPEVITFFQSHSIARSRVPIRTPAAPDLGLLPRVCVPVWHAELLLGFVWLIDSTSDPISDAVIGRLGEWVQELALALYRENLLGELAARREADAFRGLIDPAGEVRAHAVAALVADGYADTTVTALVAEHPDPAELEHALVATRRWTGQRQALHHAFPTFGVLLLFGATDRGHGRVGSGAAEVAQQLAAQLGSRVGVGDPRPTLLLAHESVNEARQALATADRLPGSAPVARWSELGIYRVLATVDLSNAHPGAATLLAAPVLAETLETYLDLAGDAAATAGRLNLHRTTLYYRLRRIEELTGADLRDGLQRLGLHLSLKSARFLVD
ncbi:hypothetical protein F4553_003550 [Allocatelliglobosispora scoriae]|uniref:PucR family transcriptional regulator n=1 Tax=Allocatelliglobosispora scoriae TaxID=643052 RepID=A0A841BTR5_9ACTN|nr:PucR family transcriptional regulator [Allocatelliglobosispora scoriae]MBB5870171.1 hypothetical protein [Allocatelliglobosispora scoriae]